VLYTHRSQTLHSMMACMPDQMALSSDAHMLMCVPSFHANGWSILAAALLAGSKLILPGPRLDGASLHALINTHRVTISAAVPTVWMALLAHLQSTPGATIASLQRVVIGGAAVPPAMLRAFEVDYGVRVCHAYGLTECSPLLTLNSAKSGVARTEEQKLKQGRAMFTVELRVVDDDGKELPWDGRTAGNLQTRGAAVITKYFKNAGGDILRDGWFDTGDVASIDEDGFVQICDRKKDIIKSGGEWISSVDVEGVAMGMPELAGEWRPWCLGCA
jgi:acyl-CoA synthetase (AMP-forming)/AMP-acid ligase II